jgi:oligopeptide/dipeptide ABC transporter ATP-binding protein
MLLVADLRTQFHTEDGIVKAVDGVSFSIEKGKTFALVGESGCGKSVTAFSIMQILPMPPAEIAGGSVKLEGRELVGLSERELRDIRGSQIGMVFQEPMTSLNPVFTCGAQIVEVIQLHRKLGGTAAREVAIEMLRKVGIPEPAVRFGEYPHQLSGGMRQRVMIAMALSCGPKLLIADEPTTALDVTIQAQILDLLRDLQRTEQMSVLLITHDLGVVAEMAHEVGVMYASRIVEMATAEDLFERPLHPYTQGLFRSLPKLGTRKARLDTIPGVVPNPLHLPSGCAFHTRCSLTRERAAAGGESVEVTADGVSCRVLKRCVEQTPGLVEMAPGRMCACWEASR